MYRVKDENIYDILNDFDLGHAGPSSNQRPGTKPYMAIDPLDKQSPKHMYCHGQEP
jgi:hypothetical protein